MGDTGVDGLLTISAIHDFINQPLSSRSVSEQLRGGDARKTIQKNRASSIGQNTPAYPQYGNVQVLVADDSPVNRHVTEQALEQFGIYPDFASNGVEAFNLGQSRPYDIIFMDCSMPKWMASRQQQFANVMIGISSNAIIIALSAHLASHIAENAQSCGMNDILVKPFTMGSMASMLENWIEGKHRNLSKADDTTMTNSEDGQTLTGSLFDDQLMTNLKEIAGAVFPCHILETQTPVQGRCSGHFRRDPQGV